MATLVEAKGAVPYLASRALSSASMAAGTGAVPIGPVPAPAESVSAKASPSAGASLTPATTAPSSSIDLTAEAAIDASAASFAFRLGADFAKTGENRGRRRLSWRRRGERAELRRIEGIDRTADALAAASHPARACL